MEKFWADLMPKYLIKRYKVCSVARPKCKAHLNKESLEYLLQKSFNRKVLSYK